MNVHNCKPNGVGCSICEQTKKIRTFDSGATKSPDENKLNYEGFLSPLVLERFAQYMHKHRIQEDGSIRTADNWQKGIPKKTYMESMWRHFMDVWNNHRVYPSTVNNQDALCALLFNVMGYLHEDLINTLPPGRIEHLHCKDCGRNLIAPTSKQTGICVVCCGFIGKNYVYK